MSEVVEIKIRPDDIQNDDVIEKALLKKSSIPWTTKKLLRKSIDARQRQIYFQLRYELFNKKEEVPVRSSKIEYQDVRNGEKVIIVGAGPAGYFAGLKLIELGFKPIILDRGKDVQARRRDLRAIQQFGEVNPHSNYCFGEGGAGTYSDGKLYTRSQKRGRIQEILEIFYDHGAPEDILYEAHPHIGSNKLPKIVTNMRETIEQYGGEVLFDQYVTDFDIKNGQIHSVKTDCGEVYYADHIILATGHSARDIYFLLHDKNITIHAKDYAIGMRIEHPQSLIDQIQYKQSPRHDQLPAASYRIACEINQKGVFSFCMCPGGLIVPAATAPGELVVNGMSLSRRDSPFSNSGFVTAVNNEDFKKYAKQGVFAGLAYQKSIERRFFEAGDGSQKAPAQNIIDFIEGKLNRNLNATSYIPGIYQAPIHELLPEPIVYRIREGLKSFQRKMPKYVSEAAQFIGLESRTSSPIRIPRESNGMHADVKGLYPCGEGAGYAGGILSAAMDGQRIAKLIHANTSK